VTSPANANARPGNERVGVDTGRSGCAIVAVTATAEDAAFAQRVLAAAEILSWCETCDDEHDARRWSVSVKKCDALAAHRRLSTVPDL
jgi:hypothetical protein